MNNRWVKDGERWQAPELIRVARRFRHHVRTPKNPNGKIEREACFNAQNCHRTTPNAEFHHTDYTRTFFGVWVCCVCHRKVDHGSLAIPETAFRDYESLIQTRKGGWVENRPPKEVQPPTQEQENQPLADPAL